MKDSYLKVSKSPSLCGEVSLLGAKNAVLVIIASLLLTRGISVLKNVPTIDDVYAMSDLLQSLGAVIHFDKQNYELHVDTTLVTSNTISAELMKKTRTSILTMGPLLALYGSVIIEDYLEGMILEQGLLIII